MNKEIFLNINKIIERESKTSTYKFALLRATIELIQENSPFINFKEGRVVIPMGLLIEKWMIYYFPIFNSKNKIPQINGGTSLSFENDLTQIIFFYEDKNGLSGFYNDLKRNGFPNEINSVVFDLAIKLNTTIRKMPMYYIGTSISSEFNSIFKPEDSRNRVRLQKIDSEFLISQFGTFSIPMEYYEVFEVLGSFMNGQNSIFFKWAEFSVNASGKQLPMEKVLENLLSSPVNERESKESKKLFENLITQTGNATCVWTGQKSTKIEVDHIIPFIIWKNNDLWNLLPANPKINNSKRDKIPTPRLIESQKNMIFHYWELINSNYPLRFQKELKTSLVGYQPVERWKESAIAQMKESCNFLIEKRGFSSWEP
jgi:hypothetical protein